MPGNGVLGFGIVSIIRLNFILNHNSHHAWKCDTTGPLKTLDVPLNPVLYMSNNVSFTNCPVAAAGRTPKEYTRMCARRERSMSEMKNPDYPSPAQGDHL